MMAKKNPSTLPHSEQDIADAKERVAVHKADLDGAQQHLEELLRENADAKRAEEVRKARVMTPRMRDTLKRLTKGERIIDIPSCAYRIGERGHWFAIDKRICERLMLAEYIRRYGQKDYQITDAGREAIK